STERRRLGLSARQEDHWVVIEVADEGIGIAPGEAERIFEKFYRIGRRETLGPGGSGGGRAPSRHIAKAQGGGGPGTAGQVRGAGSSSTCPWPGDRGVKETVACRAS